jgi:hypothetical protein
LNPFEAAKVLYREGHFKEAKYILNKLWSSPDRVENEEFFLFAALVEVWASEKPETAALFLDQVVSGENEMRGFWERRTFSEQAALLEWHGQLSHFLGDHANAHASLIRAASLGRDTAILWKTLGLLHVRAGDLEIGLRYLRRTLQLHAQPELDLLSGRDWPFGFFGGKHPLGSKIDSEECLKILLEVTQIAKNLKNLKSVRELVVEMIHQYPDESRLLKVRLMLERSIVSGAVSVTVPSASVKLTSVENSIRT